MQSGFTEREGLIGYLDRLSAGVMALADFSANPLHHLHQTVEAHPDDRAAIALVATIDELFVIDAQAQKQNLTVIERDQSWNRSRANRNGQRPDSSKERFGPAVAWRDPHP